MWTQGEGEGGTNWEIKFDINTLPCVKQIASGNQLYSTGSSTVLCDDLDGSGGGRFKQEGI